MIQDARVVLRAIYARLLRTALLLMVVFVAGAALYHDLGEGRWSWFDCLYMTVITLSTVGYGEMLPGMADVPSARALTMVLIVVGTGIVLYLLSNMTALLVGGEMKDIVRWRRMKRRIDKLSHHVVVCGVGSTGEHVVRGLVSSRIPFVVIEYNQSRIDNLSDELGIDFPYINGDATDDHVLQQVGIERAHGVIAALPDDRDNVFVTITARSLNSGARIVARAVENATESKLIRAGADSVVSPNRIGGKHLVNQLIRPAAVAFLDRMLNDTEEQLQIDDIEIPEDSNAIGKTLAESGIRDLGALVVAVRRENGKYVYNPSHSFVLSAGIHLIVLIPNENISDLKSAIGIV